MTSNCPLKNTNSSLLGLLLDPYRPFFFFGAIYNTLVMGLWFTWLHGLERGKLFLFFKVPALQTHMHWMLFGFPLFYIFGFLLTAFPKWTNGKQNSGKQNFKLALLLFLSQITFILSSLFSLTLAKISLLIEFFIQTYLFYLLLKNYLSYPQRKFLDQSCMVLVSLFFGLFAQVFFQLSIFIKFEPYYSYSLFLAKYPFLLLLMFSVSYRIIPFFASRVGVESTPNRSKNILLFSIVLFLGIGFCDLILSSQMSIFFSAIFKIILGFIWLKELLKWNIKKSLAQFLLFSHTLSFLWAILFLFLKAFFQIFNFDHSSSRASSLGIDHLLFVGGISSLLLGISTRVTRGHGGLTFKLGKLDFLIFALLQTAIIVRCFFPLLETQISALQGLSFHASFLWWLAFSIWAFRYIPVLMTRHQSQPI